MIEAVLDLETWGIRTTSVVRSVGAVLFEGRREIERHYFRIDETEQLYERPFTGALDTLGRVTFSPRTMDQSTVDWWAKPENAAAQATIQQAPLKYWNEGRDICRYIGQQAEQIWAKPAMFDLPMLRDLFGQDIWPYWKERDLSTLLGEFDPQRQTKPKFEGTPHVAIDDAVFTHQWLCRLRDMIPELTQRAYGTPGGKIWTCKIGECSEEQVHQFFAAPDGEMRDAITEAYRNVTGQAPNFLFSGWGGVLDHIERDVVEGK